MKAPIEIRVPASSANMGPGFDTLAVAVSLYNTFRVEPAKGDIRLFPASPIEPGMSDISQKMVEKASQLFFHHSGHAPIGLTITMQSEIPIARGLASSATLRLAVLAALREFCEAPVSDHDLVAWASELEGCTDNAAACFFGGMTASGYISKRLFCYKTPIPDDLIFVAVSPVGAVETDKARTVFSDTLPREDAIQSLNRAVLLSHAFAHGDFEGISALFEDWIHQPQRQAAIPALHPLRDVIEVAKACGAVGAYLSGSGSTMMAITRSNESAIADAMQKVIHQAGMDSELRILKAENQGLTVRPA